jgi:hypothetical protein
MSRTAAALTGLALVMISGQALAGQVGPDFLTTNGTTGFSFELGIDGTASQQLAFAEAPDSIQAMSTGVDGRVILHGMRNDGTGSWYYLSRDGTNLTTTKIKDTDTWYNSFTVVGERMFAVKNVATDIDQIVELNPFTFEEIAGFGQYGIGIGGLAWAPELNEFIVSDTRTNTFFGIGFDQVQTSTALREIGHAGLRWGGNGLEYYDGHVYGAAIRGEDLKLVFGEVDLQTGHFEVLRVLGDAQHAGVGLAIIPTPGSVSLLGMGGLLAARRRRR